MFFIFSCFVSHRFHSTFRCVFFFFFFFNQKTAYEMRMSDWSSDVCSSDLRQLTKHARQRHREDLASLLEHSAAERAQRARAVMDAIETLRHLPVPAPMVTDDLERWLPARAAGAMKAHGFKTLADLTVRIPRRRRWWTGIPGWGAASARQIEDFFPAHHHPTQQARALVPIGAQDDVAGSEERRVGKECGGTCRSRWMP